MSSSLFSSEIENIFFPETKEFFSEIISSFENGNYRSAIVMLYTVAITDLLLKLKYISDMYDDKKATEILNITDDQRKNFRKEKLSRSRWENDLIEKLNKEKLLIDDLAYVNLNHLYDYRNIAAHPSFEHDYRLVSINRDVVAGCIRNILEGILTRPPIFISNMINMLLEDVKEKKDLYISDKEMFRGYLIGKYFRHIGESMAISIFKSLWKMIFVLDNDECKGNRLINRYSIEILFQYKNHEIEKYIKEHPETLKVAINSDGCFIHLVAFLAEFPMLYSVLEESTKHELKVRINNNKEAKMICWFLSKDINEHLRMLIDTEYSDKVHVAYIKRLRSKCSDEGVLGLFLDFCIQYFSLSKNYDIANERYDECISPFLDKFSKDQILHILDVCNQNRQIYGRKNAYQTNTYIAQQVVKCFGDEFDFEKYQKFIFDKTEINASIADRIFDL